MENIKSIISTLLIIIGAIASIIAIIEFVKKYSFRKFKVTTVKMNKPIDDNGNFIRDSVNADQKSFMGLEENLRKSAYAKTELDTDTHFYDDSDMSSNYNLVVVTERKNNIPLLSARVYWNPLDIKNELKGDNLELQYKIQNPVTKKQINWYPSELDTYEYGDCFIVDRMSGDVENDMYKNNKNLIFGLLYKEIYNTQKGAKVFYALARRSTKERLLCNYIRIGMRIIGKTHYYNTEHWVLRGRFDCMKKHFKFIKILSKFFK